MLRYLAAVRRIRHDCKRNAELYMMLDKGK